MSIAILRGDARHLPLPDNSVSLIITSPPFYGQRDYRDGGESMAGQIGAEDTPQEYVAALVDCTREWMRVLRPDGSIFVNLGDRYSARPRRGLGAGPNAALGAVNVRAAPKTSIPPKSLMGLPWRYALACIDDLGLMLRAEIVWSKPDATPESVKDRVRRSHEQVFHFTRSRRYYSAIDQVRLPNSGYARAAGATRKTAPGVKPRTLADAVNPLGALLGSVWEIASQPLDVPADIEADHHAAFPFSLPRQCILGWSPEAVCTACGGGRFPVIEATRTLNGQLVTGSWQTERHGHALGPQGTGHWRYVTYRRTLGHACACTPFTDHPERRGKDFHQQQTRGERGANDGNGGERGANDGNGGERYRRYVEELANPRGPVREYHFDRWIPAPTRCAVVLDPFAGAGTSLVVADVLGRDAVGVELSADYCRIARWRGSDPGERARAMQVPKPPPVPDGQASLFDIGKAAT